jgi:hypothetical protein
MAEAVIPKAVRLTSTRRAEASEVYCEACVMSVLMSELAIRIGTQSAIHLIAAWLAYRT